MDMYIVRITKVVLKKYMRMTYHFKMADVIHMRNEQLEEKTDDQMMTVVI